MGKKKAASAPDFPCANAGCPVRGRDKVNKRCAGCGAVWYCGRRCQKQHWDARGGNHRGHCKAAPKPAPPKPAPPHAPAVAAGADEPIHPCPICLENEDDHGEDGMCFECGQRYCGDCNVGRVDICPTCRSPFAVPDEVHFQRLLCLVARSPGRHTPPAQFNLGMMYKRGMGVAQDHTEAVRWYRLAADQGDADGQVSLGEMYDNGTGVSQDQAKAARLYRLAADQGDAGGQVSLGVMYDNGTGVPQDHAEAVRLYRLAADQGDAGAQSNLGVSYEHGMGVPQDHTEAVRFYRLAADQGNAGGQCGLGVMYARATGTGVPHDHAEAVRLYRLAAVQGDAAAQFNLAGMHHRGSTGIPQDHTAAAGLLKLACDQGFRPARDALGMLAAQYPAGTRVQIAGLAAAAHLNGRLGTAVQPIRPLVVGRIAVRIDGQTKSVSLSWANLGRAVYALD